MNVYVILGIIAGVVAALGGTYYLGDSAGESRERAKWGSRENEQLVKKNAVIIDLTAKIRTQERQHAEGVNAISTRYQQEIGRAKKQLEGLLTASRAGTLQLFDPAGRAGGCGATPGAVSPSAARRDDGACARLHPTTAEFLLSEAARADEITVQLGRCQDVVRADRAVH